MRNFLRLTFSCIAISALIVSCGSKEQSATTGWNYNDAKWGGFEKLPNPEQATGPNLVLVEGGTFAMGQVQDDVIFDWNNIPRRVTVSTFYMDETEVANIDYREYLYWLNGTFSESYPEVVQSALPDTLVWREELSFNEPFVETYFRHPAYDDYPVVGVDWDQAQEYCKWRTDRVNEMILVAKGILNLQLEPKSEDNFNTEAYLAGQYEGDVKKNLKSLSAEGGERPVKFEDGILLPAYRLPTEAEWEYAALAISENQPNSEDERVTERKLYPWNGTGMRYQERGKGQGAMLANFKRGGGDYMGMAGKLNDNAHVTAPVRAFIANDYGLYNMAGNVSEWTLDVYRPLTSMTLEDVDQQDLNPYRGNVFKEKILDEEGRPVEKDSMGRIRYKVVDDADAAIRDNYKKGNVINYLDGDEESEINYNYGKTTLVNDKARVIKGGSWADRAYWLTPGTRRFLNEDYASRSVGFRCAMTRVGSPQGNTKKGGNYFKKKKKSPKRKFK